MNTLTLLYIYLAVIAVALYCSLLAYRPNSNESKLLSLLLGITLCSETTTCILAVTIRNNLPVYHIFSPVQFLLIALYFNESIPAFKKNATGIWIGISGIILSVLNSACLQGFNQFNSNFLLFESISIIAMSLQMFYHLIRQDDILPFRSQHFWISLIFLLFWSITYTFWGLNNAFDEKILYLIPILGSVLTTVNILTYSALAIIFFLTRKNKLSL